ncbi:MAG: hypothetical protein R2806_04395 [Saprospiraceae bacterium]
MKGSYLLTIVMIVFLASEGMAQSRTSSRRAPAKKKTEWTDHLWYGGGVSLGISNSNFGIGLAPLAGYKILESLSVGPRLDVFYNGGRYQEFFGSPVLRYNTISVGGGIFTRFKIFRGLFAHVEGDYYSLESPVSVDNLTNKIITERTTEPRLYVGAGYSTGGAGRWGSEISIVYNTLADANSVLIPWEYRIGLNYNF